MFNSYSGCMNGNPALAVINDAWQKGIRGYDVAKAYAYAVNTAEKYQNGPLGYSPGNVSATFEYGFHDWNLSQLAASLGKTEDAAKYRQRSQAYQLLFDPEVPWTYDQAGKDARPEWKGWFRPKDAKGQWEPWLGLTSNRGVTEASIYQQGWHVPHDIAGLIRLFGGREAFIAKLTDFFGMTTTTPLTSRVT